MPWPILVNTHAKYSAVVLEGYRNAVLPTSFRNSAWLMLWLLSRLRERLSRLNYATHGPSCCFEVLRAVTNIP